jgi:epsin
MPSKHATNRLVRVKAKELTALLQDDERLRQERANRSNMQTRLQGGRRGDTGSPVDVRQPQRRRTRREDDNDDEMRRAIEASKRQADEDERKRRAAAGENDDDMAKAIKLSKEDEELRQSRREDQNANLLFDDSWDQPGQQQQPQPLYQQQQQLDIWGNPIDMSAQQQMQQSTGYLQNVYSQPTGFLPQQAGYMQPQQTATNGFNNDFSSNNPYMQSQPQFVQQIGFQSTSSTQSSMSNNPYAQQQQPEALQPMPTGSNNPFAQFGTSFNQQQQPQQPQRTSFSPSLSTLSEQHQQQPQFQSTQTSSLPQNFAPSPPKPQSAHQNKLDFLLAQGNPTGQDTFGNTGELRVPAHFNRTGYVNSAGQGLRPSMTGNPTQPQLNNPFFTGQNQSGNVRPLTQSTTGPAYAQQTQIGQYGQQNQQGQTGSLIDF